MTVKAGTGRLLAGRPVSGGAQRRFPAGPDSVGLVRAFVAAEMSGFARVDDVVLCASELAANAVRHGSVRGDVYEVVVHRRRGGAYVEVIDSGGAGVPVLRDAGAFAEGFRGLALVGACASAWGWSRDEGGGCRVWCEVAMRGAGVD